MIALPNTYYPVQGKTYSLFGNGFTTHQYFNKIEEIIDELTNNGGEIQLEKLRTDLEELSSISHFKRLLFKGKSDNHLKSDLIKLLDVALGEYTSQTEKHLEELKLSKFNDKRLWTTEKQYHLYMLEIGVVNRLNLQDFKKCDYKIALLPHCLRNNDIDCKAGKDDFGRVCNNCSGECYIGMIDKFFNKYNIQTYIWSGNNFKSLYKKYKAQGKSFGVFGIACIPELMMGMRDCIKYEIPVVGVPLNANKCERWTGKKEKTSVDLTQLEKLLEE